MEEESPVDVGGMGVSVSETEKPSPPLLSRQTFGTPETAGCRLIGITCTRAVSLGHAQSLDIGAGGIVVARVLPRDSKAIASGDAEAR